MTDAPLTWDRLAAKARAEGLWAVGGFHADAGDDLPEGTQTLVLLAPGEPDFWPIFQAAPEMADGVPDPLDRWSRRVIGHMACSLGAKALFPFSGPPWRPFLAWAERTGQVHPSPVGMLVHPKAGLFFSVRGALALKAPLEVPAPVPSPCETCADMPCLTACPVNALGNGPYRIAECHGHLDRPAGADCRDLGCRARRACPVSATYPRDPAQSTFHMRAFH